MGLRQIGFKSQYVYACRLRFDLRSCRIQPCLISATDGDVIAPLGKLDCGCQTNAAGAASYYTVP